MQPEVALASDLAWVMLKLRQPAKYRQLEDGGIAAKSEGSDRPRHRVDRTARNHWPHSYNP
jgi:hypothetical protein